MAKILCVLYPDPVDGYPPTYARDTIPVLSGYPETELAVRTIRAGAAGYLNKEMAPEELVAAIRRVITGRKYVSPVVAELLAGFVGNVGESPHLSLSDREYQVMMLLSAGRTVGIRGRRPRLHHRTFRGLGTI